MKCVRKIDLQCENGKQLQVTIIKRLNVSGSTGLLGNERKKSKALTWNILHNWIKLKGLVNVVRRRNSYMCGYFIFNSPSLSSELFLFGTTLYTSYIQSMVRGGAKRISRKKKLDLWMISTRSFHIKSVTNTQKRRIINSPAILL